MHADELLKRDRRSRLRRSRRPTAKRPYAIVTRSTADALALEGFRTVFGRPRRVHAHQGLGARSAGGANRRWRGEPHRMGAASLRPHGPRRTSASRILRHSSSSSGDADVSGAWHGPEPGARGGSRPPGRAGRTLTARIDSFSQWPTYSWSMTTGTSWRHSQNFSACRRTRGPHGTNRRGRAAKRGFRGRRGRTADAGCRGSGGGGGGRYFPFAGTPPPFPQPCITLMRSPGQAQ